MSAATLSAPRASMPAAGSTLQEHVSIPDAALRLTEDVVLLDGAIVHVRAIHTDDIERLRAFHAKLSAESITYRFFRYVPELSRDEARRFSDIDYNRQMALVATQGTGDDEQIIAVVRYCGLSAETAEVAFVVADAWQGHGIATLLFHRLADYARAHGYHTFVALTMASNARMLAFFRHCGFPERVNHQDGEYEIHLDISVSPLDQPYTGGNPSALPTGR